MIQAESDEETQYTEAKKAANKKKKKKKKKKKTKLRVVHVLRLMDGYG
jgi:hypothetical protein